MKLKNTRQRENIKKLLINLREKKLHPTAEELYVMLKEYDKNISLSTVYRNIKLLLEDGFLIKIETPFGARYDANTFPHPHLYCTNCGKLIDVPIEISFEYDREYLEELGFKINQEYLILFGECKECSEK